ncbi:MAG: sulfur oxidation c-type cytochrome SoxX [Gammaproteobacteria bacterium]
MRTSRSLRAPRVAVAVLLGGLLHFQAASAAEEARKQPTPAEQGKEIAFNNRKGNCLACHMIEGSNSPGNIGPVLMAMQARFPDKAKLRAQIWDATAANPTSTMPPFGRHGILSEEEIDLVVEYLYSL